jgi:inositol phosphorylceramide mannosyltransferase catalytic subunit
MSRHMHAAIPPTLHQTWKTWPLPPRQQALAETWRRAHRHWHWRCWTDADNLALVDAHYPQLGALYREYPYPIQRVDMIRYLILHRYGGVYADLDLECFRSIEDLLHGHACLLSLESQVHSAIHRTVRIVSNAFMAATPGHPLFEAVIEDLCTHRSPETKPDRIVLDTTGPMMLTRVLDRVGDRLGIGILDPRHLFPLSMAEADRLRMGDAPQSVRTKLDEAHGMHWHDGSWWRPAPPVPSAPTSLTGWRSLARRLVKRIRRHGGCA